MSRREVRALLRRANRVADCQDKNVRTEMTPGPCPLFVEEQRDGDGADLEHEAFASSLLEGLGCDELTEAGA